MSSRPSAFDTLMSNARAAAKKKPQSQSTSPKKRKNPDAGNPAKTLNSVEAETTPNPTIPDSTHSQDETSKSTVDHEIVTKSQISSSENPSLSMVKLGQERVINTKKQRVEIADLKSKIELLKKSPGDFDPKKVLSWEKGERVPFIFVCLGFELIEKESGRILITNMVCNMLRTVMDTTPDDLLALVYLLANKIAPAHEGVELGIGESIIIKALSEAFGRTEKQVKKQLEVIVDFEFCLCFIKLIEKGAGSL